MSHRLLITHMKQTRGLRRCSGQSETLRSAGHMACQDPTAMGGERETFLTTHWTLIEQAKSWLRLFSESSDMIRLTDF